MEAGTAASFTAILFPCNSDSAQLIKVDCLARPQTSGPCKWIPIAMPHVGGQREPGSVIVTRGVGGAPLRFPMHVFYRADFLSDGSPPNRSIIKLTGGQGKRRVSSSPPLSQFRSSMPPSFLCYASFAATHIWNGNVVALKFYGTRRQG